MEQSTKPQVGDRRVPTCRTGRTRSDLHRKARSWGIRGAVLALLIALFDGGVAVGAGYLYAASTDNPIVTRGCVIRFDTLSPSGSSVVPRIHANSTHYCVGISRVYVDWGGTGDLILVGDGGPVVVAFAEEDETFSRWDIQCGPSGGGTKTRIACYRDGTHIPAWSKTLYHQHANLWVGIENWQP